jgi:hypothetical protein
VAAALPSGAVSDNAPSTGLSATTMTRNGAPFHGANGEGSTVISAASPQVAAMAGASAAITSDPTNPPATSNDAVAATANQRP